jgi:hypothetical protein
MLIEFSVDNTGSLFLKPVSRRWQRRIKKHLASFKVAWDGDVLVQEGSPDLASTLELLPERKRRVLETGWGPVMALVDDTTFLMKVGYDAHLI